MQLGEQLLERRRFDRLDHVDVQADLAIAAGPRPGPSR